MRLSACLLLSFSCIFLPGCGGGDTAGRVASPAAALQTSPRIAATATTPPDVSLAEAARQLLDLGEQQYGMYFDSHPATLASGPFLFRHYPGTGAYLGVAIGQDPGYTQNGVYVMGGPFGGAPMFLGTVDKFVTPVPHRMTVDLPNNDVVGDLARGVYYASIPGSEIGRGNRIATIDAETGAYTLSSPVGSEPGALAIAADGGSLYVALDGSYELVRLSLPGMQVLGKVRLPYDAAATSLAASPTEAGVVAASMSGSVVLVRDTAIQPQMAGLGEPITFDATGAHVLGLDTYSSGFNLSRANVTAGGLQYLDAKYAGTGYYWHSVARAGSRIITRNKLWNASDLSAYGIVGINAECLARSASRLICVHALSSYDEVPRAVTVDVDTMTLLEELAMPANTDFERRPVLGPGATLALRAGISHPAARLAQSIIIVRDEMLR